MASDYEMLMGKGTHLWQHVKTEQDRLHLKFFETLYEKNAESSSAKKNSIAKVVHCIWLGPEEFPASSLKQVQSWIDKHPSWSLMFWTDLDRTVPHPKMQKRLVENFAFYKLEDCYDSCDNVAEKSLILRYEILWQEGGVYMDHDFLLLASLDPLQENFDFYCGLECLGPTVFSTSIFPSPHLIASCPHHPAIGKTIDWLKDHFLELESAYSGVDSPSRVSNSAHLQLFLMGSKREWTRQVFEISFSLPTILACQKERLRAMDTICIKRAGSK